MQTSELKDLLIQRIRDIEDEMFLNALKVITEQQSTYRLNEFEQKKIVKARGQVDNGESFTQEEVFDRVNTWLKK